MNVLEVKSESKVKDHGIHILDSDTCFSLPLSSIHSPIFTATFAKNKGGKMVQNSSQSLSAGNIGNLGYAMSAGLMDIDTNAHMTRQQGLMDDRNARSYQSWLNWWKSTVSSDDYIKYLFTQVSGGRSISRT